MMPLIAAVPLIVLSALISAGLASFVAKRIRHRRRVRDWQASYRIALAERYGVSVLAEKGDE